MRILVDAAAPGCVFQPKRPGVIVIRLAAPLFFADAAVFTSAAKDAIASAGSDHVHDLVVDLDAVDDIDVTGAEAFEAFAQWLGENG